MKGAIMCVVPIGPDAGKLVLQPYQEEAEAFEIDTTPGTLVVLRVDTLLATHQCQGTCFLLSSFYLDDRSLDDKRNIDVPLTPAIEKLMEWATARLDQIKTSESEEQKPDVPKQWLKTMNHQSFKGQHMAARGAGIRLPVTWDPDIWFPSSFVGVDYILEVPFIRWDINNSYHPDPESWRYYRTFQKHLSFIEGPELFDNKMFSITPAESKVMDPQQRIILECGYEALFGAGLKKGKIMGSLGGMYAGYATGGSDFGFVERTTDSGAEGSFGATGGSAAITANRFSFCLGMKGPSVAIDAEDASGLVSVHLGCEALQKKGRGQVNDFSLCGGIKINMAMYYWPQQQAAGMLSKSSRCATFDASVEGWGHGDCCCSLMIKQMTEVVENQLLLKGESEPLLGVIAGTSMNNNGRNVAMNAPHAPSLQELIGHCLRAPALSGFDVDGVECYGAGGLLSDAVEVSAVSRMFRGRDGDSEPLCCACIKTLNGNSQHATGAVSILRTFFANGWGMITPGLHLHQINPHIDAVEDPVHFVSEAVEFRMRSSYMGSLARGFGGSNACALAWGRAEDQRLQPAPKLPERDHLVFWPGGGGSLSSDVQPRKGFHIAGTFTQWDPEPMEMERSGVYAFEFTLGENRWEQFQIWLDGDPKRCLHPEEAKATRLTKVFGPDPTPEGHTWLVEGRTASMLEDAEEATAALGDGSEAAAAGQLAAFREVGGIDRALIGARYRVRLHVTGKYRMVDWERLTGRPEDESQVEVVAEAAQALPQSSYFISADWNGWGFEPLPETESPGIYSLDVHLIRSGGEFQIVRNRDLEQVLYPLNGGFAGEASGIGGPDDQGEGRAWSLNGRRGNTFRIELSRRNENGLDVRNVSWKKTGDQDLSEEQKEALSRTRYAVFGSWDGGTRMRELKWGSTDYYYFFVQLGSEGKEEFQLVQDFDWGMIYFPSKADATPDVEHEIIGPSPGDGRSTGLNWTIGKDGYEKPGDIFEVKAFVKAGFFGRSLHKITWSKVSGSRDLQEAEAEGLILRRSRR
mmetsp:Transcript_61872/g.180834  ORF Transcript_61872/g.180834 Transcript_61872/m.180834 type:complete len:1030 (-) Transcript_61872:170-3259(-)